MANCGRREIAAAPVVLDQVCQKTRDKMSASSAKIVKSVIGNVCMFGVRVGAFETNPARDSICRIESKKARNRPAKPRAMLDEAGLTARQIADILGHAHPSMTQDVYMGRGAVGRDGANAWMRAWERGEFRLESIMTPTGTTSVTRPFGGPNVSA